jgi:hypothetical protein
MALTTLRAATVRCAVLDAFLATVTTLAAAGVIRRCESQKRAARYRE